MLPSHIHIQKAQGKQLDREIEAKKKAGEGIAALYRGAATRQDPTIYLKKLERALTLLMDIKEKFISNANIHTVIRNTSQHLYNDDAFGPVVIPFLPPPQHPATIKRKTGDKGYLKKMLQEKVKLQFKTNLEEILNDIAKISSLNLNITDRGGFGPTSVTMTTPQMVPIQEKKIMLGSGSYLPGLVQVPGGRGLILTLSGNPLLLGVDGTVQISVQYVKDALDYKNTSEDALKEPARFIDFLINDLNNVIGNFKHRFMSNPERRKVSFKKVTQGEGKASRGGRKTRKKKKRRKRKTHKGKRRKRKTRKGKRRKRRTRKRYR